MVRVPGHLVAASENTSLGFSTGSRAWQVRNRGIPDTAAHGVGLA